MSRILFQTPRSVVPPQPPTVSRAADIGALTSRFLSLLARADPHAAAADIFLCEPRIELRAPDQTVKTSDTPGGSAAGTAGTAAHHLRNDATARAEGAPPTCACLAQGAVWRRWCDLHTCYRTFEDCVEHASVIESVRDTMYASHADWARQLASSAREVPRGAFTHALVYVTWVCHLFALSRAYSRESLRAYARECAARIDALDANGRVASGFDTRRRLAVMRAFLACRTLEYADAMHTADEFVRSLERADFAPTGRVEVEQLYRVVLLTAHLRGMYRRIAQMQTPTDADSSACEEQLRAEVAHQSAHLELRLLKCTCMLEWHLMRGAARSRELVADFEFNVRRLTDVLAEGVEATTAAAAAAAAATMSPASSVAHAPRRTADCLIVQRTPAETIASETARAATLWLPFLAERTTWIRGFKENAPFATCNNSSVLAVYVAYNNATGKNASMRDVEDATAHLTSEASRTPPTAIAVVETHEQQKE